MSDNKAFVDTSVKLKGASDGPLRGLTFGAKDLYDVQGFRTGFGNPLWLETHSEATTTALAIQALVSAGATLVGKTTLDELAYSLTGQNMHYGTPVNPACEDRVPGGSSSGSAVAVAGGSVPFALGSDTAGSVRVPASYCGVYGMRVTWGRMSLEGARPLAPSLDAGGWFADSAGLLRTVGDVLLSGNGVASGGLSRWLVARDAFDCSLPDTSKAIYDKLSTDFAGVTALMGPPQEVEVGSVEGGLAEWMDVFRVVQGAEVWSCHGAWVSAHPHAWFGPGIKERFDMCKALTKQEIDDARGKREVIRRHLEGVLGADGVLALPCAPGPAPLITSTPQQMDDFRSRLIRLTCIASLAGLPQVSIPLARVDGCPVGLGLIGPPGSDELLLRLTEQLAAILKLP